jgi:hypothetical protein
MEIINVSGFQLIPGFLALFLLLQGNFNPDRREPVKAGRCRGTGSRNELNSTLKPVEK